MFTKGQSSELAWVTSSNIPSPLYLFSRVLPPVYIPLSLFACSPYIMFCSHIISSAHPLLTFYSFTAHILLNSCSSPTPILSPPAHPLLMPIHVLLTFCSPSAQLLLTFCSLTSLVPLACPPYLNILQKESSILVIYDKKRNVVYPHLTTFLFI